MALYVSTIAYELREIVLRDKPDRMLALSPKGTVPVLQLPNGHVIDESLDVMMWALHQHDPEGWLLPEHDTVHEMSALIARCDQEFKPHLDRYKYASRYENNAPLVQRGQGERFILTLEQRLEGSAFLFGQRASCADIAIAPFVRQFAITDWDWFMGAPYPGVQRWLNAFIAASPFTRVMDKFEPWQLGDEAVLMNA